MSEFSFTGGSLVGWVNASWPFARFNISRKQIELSTLGCYMFTPQQVVSLDKYGLVPVLSSGIRINHNRLDYPEKIVFWCVGGRSRVFDAIKQAGFIATGAPATRPAGIPFKWTPLIVAFAVWNLLFVADRALEGWDWNSGTPGPFSVVAFLILFSTSFALPRSDRLQRIVMAPEHQVSEIRSMLILIQIISGFLFIGFAATVIHRLLYG